ncbi:MAG: DUF1329 domain-containing protein [Myxococcota bacterium]
MSNPRIHRAGPRRPGVLAIGALALLATQARAQVTAEEAAELGRSLTPVGAERAGNAEGTIPEWTGGYTTPPDGWEVGEVRIDPFSEDRPRLRIDADNVDRYADQLSPGQRALIAKHAGYRMDVYPTRRSCGYPEWVYEASRRNAQPGAVELDESGNALVKGWHSFLFPIPKNGHQVMWNHTLSFLSRGKVEYYATVVPTRSGAMNPVESKITYDALIFDQRYHDVSDAGGRAASIVLERLAPARLAGQVVLVHEMVNEQRRAWIYNPGQRRVRRAPTTAYDNPLNGTENLMTNDQTRMFNGLLDRFDWKLVGKQELYVPYNSFAMNYGENLTYQDALGAAYPNRDLMRYELHRVWVVEATVKPGQRHLYHKRVFYLDEDSWYAVVQDIYDKRGELWRVMEGMVVPIAEVPSCSLDGVFSFDLVAGRYAADQIKTAQPPSDWLAGREGRIPEAIFKPDALRRMGRR